MLRRAGAAGAVLLMVVGATVVITASVVHDEVLRPELYEDALVTNRVYRRIYSEVLTDPSVREFTDEVLGNFDVGGRSLADRTALTNALVRLALPPEVLRDVTEEIIETVLAYLRGDSPRLDSRVTLVGALERVDEAASVVVRDVLVRTTTELLTNLDSYESAVRKFAEELAAGTIPTSVPAIGGNSVTEADIIAAIDRATQFGLPRAVRDQVMAAVRSRKERDALITAAAALTRSHVTTLSTALADGTELQLDYMQALGGGNAPQRQTIERLNTIRRAVGWFPPWFRFLGLGLLVAGSALLLGSCRRRPVRAAVALGLGLGLAGIVVWLSWRFGSQRFGSPIGGAASSGTALPTSVTKVLADVDRSLGDALDREVARRVSAIITASLVVLAIAALIVITNWFRTADRRRALAAGAITIASCCGAVWLLPSPTAPPASRECNGHRELCGRRYDEIVQAATHNSMSSPDVVRIWPEHDGDIRAQLDFGIRTLLIDTKYWTAVDTAAELSTVERLLPADIASSLFEALGSRTHPRPGTYLCHSRCAYGAIPFGAALRTIKSFLDDNPDEVVTLIIEDEISRKDTALAFADVGLTDMVYDSNDQGAEHWPTLGDLIERGERVVVFSEHLGPPPSWYRDVDDVIQDTPFDVRDAGMFTCALNRGAADAPLFLLNHWVQREAPDRADAVVVNEQRFIVDRARACNAERGRLPNFIAVNFFSIGDLMHAVDELNEV